MLIRLFIRMWVAAQLWETASHAKSPGRKERVVGKTAFFGFDFAFAINLPALVVLEAPSSAMAF